MNDKANMVTRREMYKNVDNMTQKKILRKVFSECVFQVTSFTKTNNEHIFDIRDGNNVFTTVKLNTHFRFLSCECADLTISEKRNTVCEHICFLVLIAGGVYSLNFIKNKILNLGEMIVMLTNIEVVWKKSYLSILSDRKETLFMKNKGCSICYDTFVIRDDHKIRDLFSITSCNKCQNLVHVSCMNKWLTTSNKCIFCRIEWD